MKNSKPFLPQQIGSQSYFSGINNSFDVTVNYKKLYPDISFNGIQIITIESENDSLENIPLGQFGLENIPLGQFGLKSYQIKNTNSYKAVLIIPTADSFPNEISYYYKTSCKLPSTELEPQDFCWLILKYQPVIETDNLNLILQMHYITSSINMTPLPLITIPFNTRR